MFDATSGLDFGDKQLKGLAVFSTSPPASVSQSSPPLHASNPDCITAVPDITQPYSSGCRAVFPPFLFYSSPPPPRQSSTTLAKLSYSGVGMGLWSDRMQAGQEWVQGDLTGSNCDTWSIPLFFSFSIPVKPSPGRRARKGGEREHRRFSSAVCIGSTGLELETTGEGTGGRNLCWSRPVVNFSITDRVRGLLAKWRIASTTDTGYGFMYACIDARPGLSSIVTTSPSNPGYRR